MKALFVSLTIAFAVCVAAVAQSDSSQKDVTVSEAEKLVKEKKVVVLDVRTPKEFAAGHIAGAKNIDFNAPDFEKKVAELDKDKSYLVHCAAGGRSGKSMAAFKKQKFKSVYHMNEGFKTWEKAGKAVEK